MAEEKEVNTEHTYHVQLNGRRNNSIELTLDGMALQISRNTYGDYSIMFPKGVEVSGDLETTYTRVIIRAKNLYTQSASK